MSFSYLTESIVEVQKSSNDREKEDTSWGASYNAVKATEKKLAAMFKVCGFSAQVGTTTKLIHRRFKMPVK